MKTVDIDDREVRDDFGQASRLARDTARQHAMQDPTIVSWHQSSNRHVSSYYDGANPDTWWEKYGAGNGGELEVRVGHDFDFIMMDAKDFEPLGEMPLRNLSDAAGHQFVCYTPILGRESKTPTAEACSELDDWAADQF